MIYPELKDIGQAAKFRRKAMALSQEQAAAKIQAHRNEISRMENGKYTGNLGTFIRYLNLVGLKLGIEVAQNPTLDDLDKLFNEDL